MNRLGSWRGVESDACTDDARGRAHCEASRSSGSRSRSTSARRPVKSSQRKRTSRPVRRMTSAIKASQVTRRQRGRATARARTSRRSLGRMRRSGKSCSRIASRRRSQWRSTAPRSRGSVRPARELAQQLEQLQVRPCSRFESMGLGLGDGDGPASDRQPQDWLQLAEGGLPLHDSAQVVLIEVKQGGPSRAAGRRGRKPQPPTHRARRPPVRNRRVRPKRSSRSGLIRPRSLRRR